MTAARRTAPFPAQTHPLLPFDGQLDQRIPSTLTLLDDFVRHWFADRRPLAGVTVLHIQHQLAQQVPQARALLRLGVAPEDFYWIDIPYSANENVVAALQAEGVPEENFDCYSAGVLEPYALRQLERIQTRVRYFLDRPPNQLLVLDDGAYLLEALSCFNPATLHDRLPTLCVVEQTTRGIIKMEHNAAMWRLGHELPIVDVARSDTKITLESPYVGLCVCAALSGKLGQSLARMSKTGRSLVLGYGDVGRAVARYLVETSDFSPDRVFVSDPDPEKRLDATARGFPLWHREDRDFDTRFDLVVGCSGRDSFRLGDYVFLEDGAFLVSASSGTVELSRRTFIEWADATDFDDAHIVNRRALEATRDYHVDLEFELVDRTATFVNAGFPVNFDGRVRIIPDRYMQATQALMIAGAVQAVEAAREGRQGILDIDAEQSAWIRNAFLDNLRENEDPFPGTLPH